MIREHRAILVIKGQGIPPCDAAVNQYPGRVASPFFDFVTSSHCPGKHLRSLQHFLIGSENRGVGRHWPTLYAHLRVVAYSAGGDGFVCPWLQLLSRFHSVQSPSHLTLAKLFYPSGLR